MSLPLLMAALTGADVILLYELFRILPDGVKLDPGENTIAFTGGITAVAVLPRWCSL